MRRNVGKGDAYGSHPAHHQQWTYRLNARRGLCTPRPWKEAKSLHSKSESVSIFNTLEGMFQATYYQPIPLLNATAQLALSHHLDDELSKKLSVAVNAAPANQHGGASCMYPSLVIAGFPPRPAGLCLLPWVQGRRAVRDSLMLPGEVVYDGASPWPHVIARQDWSPGWGDAAVATRQQRCALSLAHKARLTCLQAVIMPTAAAMRGCLQRVRCSQKCWSFTVTTSGNSQ
jgi:hypothetical protein